MFILQIYFPLISFLFAPISQAISPKIPIQSFTTSLDEGLKPAMEFILDRMNSASGGPRPFLLWHRHKIFPKMPVENGWEMMENVCLTMENPGFALILIGEWRPRGHWPFWMVSTGMEMPMVNWELTPRAFEGENGENKFEVSIRPPNGQFLAEMVLHKKWRKFTYLHDWENAGRAAQIAREMSENWAKMGGSKRPIHFEFLQLPKHSQEFGLFLGHFLSERFKMNEEIGGHRILLDAANPYRQQKLLEIVGAIGEKDKSSRKEFILANFDLPQSDIEMLKKAKVNILWGQMVDWDSHEFGQLMRHLEALKLAKNREAAELEATRLSYVHDSFLVVKNAFWAALARNESILSGIFADGQFLPRIRCHPRKSFELGKIIGQSLNRLRLPSEQGTLTGDIEFDGRGIRRNFGVKVVELEGENEGRKTVRHWRQGSGFLEEPKPSMRSVDSGKNNFGGNIPPLEGQRRALRVATVLSDPFVMVKPKCRTNGTEEGECQGNGRFEGYCIDLLKLLGEHIADFHFELFTSVANRYGMRQPDGSYDGIIGHLLRGEADLSLASLTINQERERVIDFSQPFLTTGISIMIKKPDREEFSLLRFMAPLSNEVWLCIMFAFIGVSIVIYFAARFSPFEFHFAKGETNENEQSDGIYRRRRSSAAAKDGWTVFNSLWFTWAALLGGGGDMSPRSLSVRIASSTWFFFTLIMISSYTANLAAFLTIERMNAPIESIEDLAKQTKIKYGIQQGGSTEQFFKHSSVPIYQQMWKFMDGQAEKISSVFVNTYAEGIERVRKEKGKYAFLLESTANEYANMRLPCDTMKVGENLNSVGYGVATPFGSELKDQINLAILALQETGQLRKLRNKWWYDRGQCSEEGGIDSTTESLTLRNVAGVFYVLIAGMALALVVAFVERIYRRRKGDKGGGECVRQLMMKMNGNEGINLENNKLTI